MRYRLLIKREARKVLKRLVRADRNRITEKIMALSRNPDSLGLDVKPLKTSSCYRFRVGRWRVVFTRNNDIKIIAVEQIGPRGDVYK